MRFSTKRVALTAVLSLIAAALSPVSAKEIAGGVAPSENKIYIRTDGLACYFCAYGLERFFKKTGRIAAFDMDMKEGIVEVRPIRGKPLVSARDLRRYVHDAGFTPRWIQVELVGRFVQEGENLTFAVAETGERLPVSSGMEELPAGEVRVEAKGLEHESAPFALEVERYESLEDGP